MNSSKLTVQQDGDAVGVEVVGAFVGRAVVGVSDGVEVVGAFDGPEVVGAVVVGMADGAELEGESVGALVGPAVQPEHVTAHTAKAAAGTPSSVKQRRRSTSWMQSARPIISAKPPSPWRSAQLVGVIEGAFDGVAVGTDEAGEADGDEEAGAVVGPNVWPSRVGARDDGAEVGATVVGAVVAGDAEGVLVGRAVAGDTEGVLAVGNAVGEVLSGDAVGYQVSPRTVGRRDDGEPVGDVVMGPTVGPVEGLNEGAAVQPEHVTMQNPRTRASPQRLSDSTDAQSIAGLSTKAASFSANFWAHDVGELDGLLVGAEVVGLFEGKEVVGVCVGLSVGWLLGLAVGFAVGLAVGFAVGWAVGVADGCRVGLAVGFPLGCCVGGTVGEPVWCEQSPGLVSRRASSSAGLVVSPVRHSISSLSQPQANSMEFAKPLLMPSLSSPPLLSPLPSSSSPPSSSSAARVRPSLIVPGDHAVGPIQVSSPGAPMRCSDAPSRVV